MGILKRITNLWNLSSYDTYDSGDILKDGELLGFLKKRPKAEFIVPNKVEEIIKNKENPTIDDVLQ